MILYGSLKKTGQEWILVYLGQILLVYSLGPLYDLGVLIKYDV